MVKEPNLKKCVAGAVLLVALLCATAPAGDVIHVKVGSAGDGSSWANAYGDLQDGLDDADPCDVIWVAEGTYYPSNQTDPCDARTATFQLITGVAIYGGFEATGDPEWGDRDFVTNETTLSGDIGVADPCDNSYHVVTGSTTNQTAILDGFTITAGYADGSSPIHNCGGGIYNNNGKSDRGQLPPNQ